MNREGGYYWVIFPYVKWGGKLTPTHWEVGSYDRAANAWCLIGSKDQWFEWQLQFIGAKIEPPKIIDLTEIEKQNKIKG